MRKPEIAKQWARQSGVSEEEAADQLDSAIAQILTRVRQNGEAPLPGIGKFRRAADGKLRLERGGGSKRA